MGSVSLRNIRKSYGKVEVLHGVNVDVADGEFVVLVGPSGCGKSTLLRSLAGLETLSDGEIAINGELINQLPPKDEKDRKVNEAAGILGLEPLLDRYPKQLSGGQRQRVAMGRAIVRNPKVFLFDEPLSNLDAKLRVQMRAEIKELHQRLGTTIVYVTHDQIEAMTMADKIVVMRGGVIEQMGAPLDLYDRPANQFVAGFIGSPSMNFLDATVKAGRICLRDDLSIAAAPEELADNQPVTIGVRPEHLVIDDSGTPARVTLLEPTGAETQLLAELGGQTVTMTTRDRVDARVGDSVRLSIVPGKLHCFDAKSGAAIATSQA